MSKTPEADLSSLQKSATRYEVYAVSGTALMHALSAQFALTTQLLQTLIASNVMSADSARELLLAYAQALEKMSPTSEEARKVIGHTLVGKRLENHAKALRGFAMKINKP